MVGIFRPCLMTPEGNHFEHLSLIPFSDVCINHETCTDELIWQCVKTLYPCSSHQNSWEMDVHPTKNGINRY